MFNLKDKTALVTGASGGIGESIAMALHKQGAKVCITGTNLEKLNKINQSASMAYNQVVCDLSNKDDLKTLRPKIGIGASFFNKIVNKKLKKNINKNEPIFWKDIF